MGGEYYLLCIALMRGMDAGESGRRQRVRRRRGRENRRKGGSEEVEREDKGIEWQEQRFKR